MRSKTHLFHSLLLLFVISGFSQSVLSIGKYEITPEQLNKQLQANEKKIIIDLREQPNYQQSHIPGAAHVHIDELTKRLDQLQAYKNKEIILYCGDGTRSVRGMSILRQSGFKNILNLHGNMRAWLKKKLPVSTTEKTLSEILKPTP